MNKAMSLDWYKANQSYLLKEMRYVRSLLQNASKQQAKQSQLPIEEQPELGAIFESAPPALEKLCTIFKLSAFERKILLLCVALELDSSFETLCSEVPSHNKCTYPTLNLALTTLPGAHWSVLNPESPLRYWELIEIGVGQALAKSPLKIHESILSYLLGERCLDQKLRGIVKPVDMDKAASKKLQPSHQEIATQLGGIWLETSSFSHPNRAVQLCGAFFGTNIDIATTACYCAGYNLYIMEAHALPTSPDDLKQFILRWQREALLSKSALLVNCHEVRTEDTAILFALSQLVKNINGRLIITCSERLSLPSCSLINIDVKKLTASEQIAIWNSALGTAASSLGKQVEVLVSQFNLSQEAIYTAASTAFTITNTGVHKESDVNNLSIALWNACRNQARPQLDDLAQRIDTKATWDDLVLPEAPLQTIREMINQVKKRMEVYEKWGFAGRSSRGLGISVLLAGESGTGKTMTAEVIANELGLDAYKIDLSKVVSKYIGDTEKNIGRVFNAAETGGAVLLFDEADALFSKRTEVKDSRDRNANMEINYLLQRMEAYNGLAILTTNLKDSIDSAFMRRIRFIVKYRFPEIAEREQVWRRIFPSNTPTSGLDYGKLAKLCVTGGSIRNIALNAAFLAAQEEEPVMMKYIKQAAQTEYLKLGKSLTDVETRGWPC